MPQPSTHHSVGCAFGLILIRTPEHPKRFLPEMLFPRLECAVGVHLEPVVQVLEHTLRKSGICRSRERQTIGQTQLDVRCPRSLVAAFDVDGRLESSPRNLFCERRCAERQEPRSEVTIW